MAELKSKPTFCTLEPTFHEAMMNYIRDNNLTISEFVRACILDRLLDKGYITPEQLELVVV